MEKIKIQRANMILRISPEEKDKYLQQGFSVVDETGNILESAEPTDAQGLKILVEELKSEIARKNEEIARLKKSSTSPKKKAIEVE